MKFIKITSFQKNGKYSSIGRIVDCGSKGCRFKSFFLPLIFFNFLRFFTYFTHNITEFTQGVISNLMQKLLFLKSFYTLTGLIWQDGLLLDFLQKKWADNWTKKFLVYSSYLFNERLVFDKVTRFYLDLVIWPMHRFSIFEVNSVSSMLLMNIFFFILSFLLCVVLFFIMF